MTHPPAPSPASGRRGTLCLVLLALIVLLGGWLRCSRLDLMEFKKDEWELHELALKQAHGQAQLHGLVSSVGVHNPPMAVYLFTLPALISANPVTMAWLPALLGTAAIALTYVLARRWMGGGPALAAALLFAVSPWAVLHARKIWAQDLLPFFAILFFLAAVNWLRHGRWRDILLLCGTLAVLNQIHYSSLAFWPVVLFLLWRRHTRPNLKRWLVGAAVMALLWTPFILFLFRAGAQEVAKQTVTRERKAFHAELWRGMKWQVWLMDHGAFQDVGPSREELAGQERPFNWPAPIFAILLAGGVAATVLRARQQPELWLVLLWFGLPPLLLSLHRVFSHYLIICWPSTFLMAGLVLDEAWRRVRPRLTTVRARAAAGSVAAAGLLLLAAHEVMFIQGFLDLVSEKGGTLRIYGVTYREKLRVARFLVEQRPEGPFGFMDNTHPSPAEDSYGYLYRQLGGRGRLVPLRALKAAVPAPVFVALDPGVDAFPAESIGMRNATVTPIKPLRVQVILPRESPTDPKAPSIRMPT